MDTRIRGYVDIWHLDTCLNGSARVDPPVKFGKSAGRGPGRIFPENRIGGWVGLAAVIIERCAAGAPQR